VAFGIHFDSPQRYADEMATLPTIIPSLFVWAKRLAAIVLLVATVRAEPALRAQTTAKTPETPETATRKKQREENLKVMKERAADAKVRLVSPGTKSDADLVPQPLFHYTDQPRRIADATLWGWLADGRLVAACKIEKYDHENPAIQWLYCFGSLAPGLIESEWPSGHTFAAKKPGIELARIAAAPVPAAGRPARLRQMKEIADHFSATVSDATVGDRRQEMRLLPRPIYRYEKPARDVQDGAVFGFTANGTNPDAILVVELHQNGNAGGEWKFGMTGMTTGGLSVKFDDKEVWSQPSVPGTAASFDTWEWFWAKPK
jgi:hypothetical protein